MRLREKDKKDAEVVTLGWDEAQAALQAGTHVVVNDDVGEVTASEEDREPKAPA
ncbi:hypothetical protein [Methylobacterium gossipiicola]|uniref:Uncharacterized protein n=1 Tax=Methylobacterium gossipiicola TaxID=582675 RepID=A0A1I2VUB2_9HYPH|nr:hypothetical protein [Methylobacterium gossipiicola]SFG92855.1 hypothetical protein SAMN05192565_11796 [Methylobacterium gossipiicola]